MSLVTLSDHGLYCAAGDFHIDPRHRVARAVVTHAHGDHARPGCGRYWTSASSAPLLLERLGQGSGIVPLAYGETVEFGRVRVSLHPAGHILGSAQVRMEHAGEVWVVSGDYKREADPSCEPFEVVPCDVFVTEATFGEPMFAWPDPGEVAGEMLDWWRQCQRQGLCALLCCYALGKCQRVLAQLAQLCTDGPAPTVYLHSTMSRLVKLYRQSGVPMLPTESVGAVPRFFDWRGRLVLAPPGVRGTSWVKRFRPLSLGFASGWMHPAAVHNAGYDRGFALSDHADWPGLLRTVQQTGARRVLAMHGGTETLVRHLLEHGVDAAPLAGCRP